MNAGDPVVLDVLKVGAVREFSDWEITANPRAYVVREAGKAVLRLQADILADRLPPATIERDWSVTWPFPSSPWQFWKRRHGSSWWLAWFVRRWPVKVDPHERRMQLTVDIERYRTFPQARVQLPDDTLGRPILWSQTTPVWEQD